MNAKSISPGQTQLRTHRHLARGTSFTNAWPQRAEANRLSEHLETRTRGRKQTFLPMLMTMAIAAVAATRAFAYPGRTDACTGCHNDGSGNLIPSPNTLNVVAGNSGFILFEATSLPEPGGGNTVIALADLTQASLAASIGPAGDNWYIDATMTKSGQFTSPGVHTLELLIGAAATPGSYSLTWYLAGAGPSGTSGKFTVNVMESPPTLSIVPATQGTATISWSPATGTNWVLQQSSTVAPANWTNSPSGSTNPIVVSTKSTATFYRLSRP